MDAHTRAINTQPRGADMTADEFVDDQEDAAAVTSVVDAAAAAVTVVRLRWVRRRGAARESVVVLRMARCLSVIVAACPPRYASCTL